MPKHSFFRVIPIIMLLALFLPVLDAAAVEGERLIVFTQKKNSAVGKHFQNKLLPEIKKRAKRLGVPVSVYEGEKGFPKEVTITPLIIYQNHLGRSVYQGRTKGLKRIENFIRTSRRLPQGKKPLVLNDIPVMAAGKSKIWSPVKISPVSGKKPVGYQESQFLALARKDILKGFKKYKIKKEGHFGRGDRGFYMDFYPWCSGDGTLYLSLALFSQFHCKAPVFKLSGETLKGPWNDREKLFERAAVVMEEAVQTSMDNPEEGDGFIPVPDSALTVSWEDIGYPLPELKDKKQAVIINPPKLSEKWKTPKKSKPETEPAIQFRFPAPLDSYLGEARMFSSSVSFNENMLISSMKGEIEVKANSVTMGEDDLDKTIQGFLFLDTKTYPTASFKIIKAEGLGTLEFAQLSIVNIQGSFQMKDKVIPLSLPLTLEAIVDPDGKPLLLITGSFSIDLRDFEIEGATGPEPEKYTLLFDLNLFLSPASKFMKP